VQLTGDIFGAVVEHGASHEVTMWCGKLQYLCCSYVMSWCNTLLTQLLRNLVRESGTLNGQWSFLLL